MANQEVLNFINRIRSIDFSLGAWDLLILLLLGVGSMVYAHFFVNRGKILPVLVSTYMAFVLVSLAPMLTQEFGERFGIRELFLLRFLAFALIFLFSLLVLSRVIFQAPVGSETFGVLASFFLAMSQVGFLLSLLISFLPPEVTREFSDFLSRLFVGDNSLFYWALAPVVLLLLFGRKANREVG